MQNLLLVGTSHRFIDPSRLGLLPTGDELRARLGAARAEGRVAGFVVLSTCNRLECYLEVSDPKSACDLPQDILRELFDIPGTTAQGQEVLRHLLHVAGSLGSMILGENQILGQVKKAWQKSQDEGECSPLLHEVFRHAVTGAKEIRNATGLGERPVSVASLAARHLVDRLSQHSLSQRSLSQQNRQEHPRIALIGAGEMIRKASPAVVEACGGKCELLFVNRTFSKAEQLALEFGGRAMSLSDFYNETPGCEALIVAVWGKDPLCDVDLAEKVADAREREARSPGEIELVDLGVPACIAPELGADPRFHLLDMDTLNAWSRRHASERRKAAARALPIIERHVRAFVARRESRKFNLSGVREAHLQLAEDQIRQLVGSKLAHLSLDDRARIERGFLDLAKAHAHLHLKDLRSMVATSVG
ncbi:MAG: hypothetical protein CSA62_08240 [Planctomycetota bacterium]|nr:MAG: hypothetical protein CSA62_08240 [Planctomycetota bacterium]